MNRKRFLNRQIFVTSVVSDSPTKPPLAQHQPAAKTSDTQTEQTNSENSILAPSLEIPLSYSTPSCLSLDLGKPLTLLPPGTPAPTSSGSSLEDSLEKEFEFSSVSPGLQDKINRLEQSSGSKFFVTPVNKRKSEGSPENLELSRKEKKIQRSAEKKNRKQELKASKTLQVQKSF